MFNQHLSVLALIGLFRTVSAVTPWTDVDYKNRIMIDGQIGNDGPSCLEPNSLRPCKSLSYALQGYRNDSTLYTLNQGSYSLNSSVEIFTNLTVIGISGNNSSVVCADNAGLAFQNVSYINIADVTFLSCGALRNSTSRNYSDGDAIILSTFKVGLYFYLCSDVHLDTIVVANSISATGVVMYDTIGSNLIISSEFYNNSVPDRSISLLGGGGFYVEFTYCSPDGYCGNKRQNSGSNFIFIYCFFHNNVAMDAISQQDHSIPIIPNKENHVAFGRGGGLSLFFNGNASDNTLSIINCNFSNNQALYGGGLFMEFHDTAVGNIIGVTGCQFLNNSTPFDGTSGGGIRIGHFVLTNNGASYNNVTLDNNNFCSNSGFYGGGLSIEPALQNTAQSYAVAYFRIQDCQFVGNVATLGSAVYVVLFTLITTGLPPSVNFYHTLVQGNVLNTSNQYEKYGAVYIHLVPVKFRDLIRFDNNDGSALALIASHADFASCRAEFFGNVGPKGAAIALLGASWLLIGNDTRMRFENNIATLDGGAIYNMYIEKEGFPTSTNCFLKYTEATVSPENWTARFTFINNSDSQGQNSIHSTSILPCGVLSSIPDKNKIFCWSDMYWNYSGSCCTHQISTDASQVSLLSTLNIYPGQIALLQLNVTDDLGNDVLNQTVFNGFINSTFAALSPQFAYLSRGYVQLSGNSNGSITLSLNVAGDSDQLYAEIAINVIQCPPGLIQSSNDKTATCICDSDPRTGSFGGLLLCLGAQSNNTAPALLQQGNWIGTIGINPALFAGPCPPGYCDGESTTSLLGEYIKLPQTAQRLDEAICSGNRMGILCGECKNGYSPAINSFTYQCILCNQSDTASNVFKYIGVVYVPLVVFFIIIILFRIRLTAGMANVLILYSQVISSTFDLTVSGYITRNIDNADILTMSYRFLYGIFNLDFFSALVHPFCIADNLNTLDILSLNYIVALSPLAMIIILLVSIKVVGNRCLNNCARCKIPISPMMAFSSFLLLSYNKLTLTSTLILSENSLITSSATLSGYVRVYSAGQYSSTDNTFVTRYAIMAYLLLLIPILLPIVLFGYPVHFLERMVNKVPFFHKHYPADKINIFLDTFQGDFKDNRRFYASFYFLFRLVVAVEFIVAVSGVNQLILQLGTCVIMIFITALLRPYKKPFLNNVDILMFTNMAMLASLSMYILQNPSSKNVIPFSLQYVLIMSPAILYTGIYLVWWIKGPSVVRILFHLDSSRAHTSMDATAERSSLLDEEDVLINRSRETISYTHLYSSVSEKTIMDSGKREEPINS